MAARDLDRLLELYEPDAVFVPQPDAIHRGREAIRAALVLRRQADGSFRVAIDHP